MELQSLGTEIAVAVLARGPMTNSQLAPYRAARRKRQSWSARARELLRLWRQRLQQRAELARLSECDLRDFGWTEADVWRETEKWFWQD